ncbi:MAG: hypothetical protein ACK4ND_08960 [Cytophagaceae bacterium]
MIRDNIWYDMIHLKHGEVYLAHYLGLQKTIRKWFKIITLIFSGSGIFSWAIWGSGTFAVIACIVIAVIQILSLIEGQIIANESDLEKIGLLRNKYLSYFNKVEKLWVDFNAKRISETEATEKFFKLRKKSEQIEVLDNELHIIKLGILIKASDTDVRNYIDQYHSKAKKHEQEKQTN